MTAASYVVADADFNRVDDFAANDRTAATTEFALRKYPAGTSLYAADEWAKVEAGFRSSARRIAFESAPAA